MAAVIMKTSLFWRRAVLFIENSKAIDRQLMTILHRPAWMLPLSIRTATSCMSVHLRSDPQGLHDMSCVSTAPHALMHTVNVQGVRGQAADVVAKKREILRILFQQQAQDGGQCHVQCTQFLPILNSTGIAHDLVAEQYSGCYHSLSLSQRIGLDSMVLLLDYLTCFLRGPERDI